jgi:molecular chaperone Hsp33
MVAKEAGLRGLACVTTNLVKEAAQRHEASPTATAALGHILTAGVLMGTLLKVQQRVAIKVQGNGPLRKMLAEADSYGRVRGYVTPADVVLPVPYDAEDVSAAVGSLGLLTVVKDLRMREPVEGIVPLQTGKMDADLVFYLMQSEQVPSLVEIDAKLDQRGRLTVQAGCSSNIADRDPRRGHLSERMDDHRRWGAACQWRDPRIDPRGLAGGQGL